MTLSRGKVPHAGRGSNQTAIPAFWFAGAHGSSTVTGILLVEGPGGEVEKRAKRAKRDKRDKRDKREKRAKRANGPTMAVPRMNLRLGAGPTFERVPVPRRRSASGRRLSPPGVSGQRRNTGPLKP